MYSEILKCAQGTYNGSIIDLAVQVIEELANLNARVSKLEAAECCCPSEEETCCEPAPMDTMIPDEQRDPTDLEKYGPGIEFDRVRV